MQLPTKHICHCYSLFLLLNGRTYKLPKSLGSANRALSKRSEDEIFVYELFTDVDY